MIKNKSHYRSQKSRLGELLKIADDIKAKESSMSPIHFRIELDTNQYQIEDIKNELDEYDKIESGIKRILSCNSFNDISKLLIQSRIATKMTHEQLAEKVGVHTQQIQKYEANDYNEVKLERLIEIAYALGIGDNFCATVNLDDSKLFGQSKVSRFSLGEFSEVIQKAQEKVREQKSLFVGTI